MNNNLSPIISTINLSATMAQKKPEGGGYTRIDNPTRLLLEQKLARLEKGKFALAFSSGSAAATACLLNLKSGDHIICSQDIYEGTLRLLEKLFTNLKIDFSLVNFSKNQKIKSAIKPNTKLIWFENITNPTLKQINTKRIKQVVKNQNILILVDNSFATPMFKNPLLEGADIVIHSLTKFIGGHHDVLAGAIIVNNKKLFNQLKFIQQTTGSVPSAFDCFLILQHLKTFPIRMKIHNKNAIKISRFLAKHSKIKSVTFPGSSGVVYFWIKNQPQVFLKKLKLIKIAHSFGGVSSTILHPVSMMSWSFSKKKLDSMKITNHLFRLSVGIEDANLIIDDLNQALK